MTVVFGNTDGGSADFAIVLLNTANVAADDFIFTPPAGAAAAMSSAAFGDQYDMMNESRMTSALYGDYAIV